MNNLQIPQFCPYQQRKSVNMPYGFIAEIISKYYHSIISIRRKYYNQL